MSSAVLIQVRRSLVATVAVVAAAALGAPVAGATVTTTNVTSSTIKAWDMLDSVGSRSNPINDRTVSGTVDSSATAGETVKVHCFNPVSGDSLATFGSATVTAAKKWSVTASLSGIFNRHCRIVAVPDGVSSVSAADLSTKYRGGKLSGIGYWSLSYTNLGGSPGNAFVHDYEFDQVSKTVGPWFFNSIGSCGLCGSQIPDPATGVVTSMNFWYFQANTNEVWEPFPTPPASGPNADPLLLVDGKMAFDPYIAAVRTKASRSVHAAGAKGGISVSYSINQANGDVTIRESMPTYRCVDQTDPTRYMLCTSVVDTGVKLNRVVTVTADHAIWRSADTFSSADNKAHSVRITYVNYQKGGTSGYRFGTAGAYAPSTKGDKAGNALGVVARNAYAVLGVRADASNATPSYSNPLGDVVMTPRPALIRFDGDNSNYWFPRWNLTVPAKGQSPTVKQAYTIALSDANLVKLRNAAIAGLAK